MDYSDEVKKSAISPVEEMHVVTKIASIIGVSILYVISDSIFVFSPCFKRHYNIAGHILNYMLLPGP